MFCEISGLLSHAAYTDRKVYNCGPFNLDTWTSQPCGILKGLQFFKRSKIFQKRSKISNAPPWKFDKNIPAWCFWITTLTRYGRLWRELFEFVACKSCHPSFAIITAAPNRITPWSSYSPSIYNCFKTIWCIGECVGDGQTSDCWNVSWPNDLSIWLTNYISYPGDSWATLSTEL